FEDDRRVVGRGVLAELPRAQDLRAILELVEALELALGDLPQAVPVPGPVAGRGPVSCPAARPRPGLVRRPPVDADAGLAGLLVPVEGGVLAEVLLPARAARDLAVQLPAAEHLPAAPGAQADASELLDD